jgi:hypothetical protein
VVDGTGLSWRQRADKFLANLYYTSVPALFRKVDYGGFTPHDTATHLRDEYFNAVQSSVPMMAGSLGAVIACCLWWAERRSFARNSVGYWTTLLGVAFPVGIAVHTEAIPAGVGQICLLPLALIVTAWLAARLPGRPFLFGLLLPGLACDAVLGILLHFATQSMWVHRWHYAIAPDKDVIHLFGFAARMNYEARLRIAEPFLQDLPGAKLVTFLLLAGAAVALVRGLWSVRSRPLGG